MGGARSGAAGQWDINAGIGIEETYSDNVGLVDDNADRNSDLITDLSPTLSVRGSGGRASLDLDFQYSRLFYKNDDDRNEGITTLNSRGQAEIWDRIAFIDATASTSRQVTSSDGAVANSTAGQTVNRSDVTSFEVSPFLLHHFGEWVETETRLRFNRVNVEGDVSNNTTIEEQFRANGGQRFSRLGWVATIDNFKEDRGNDTPQRSSFNGDLNLSFAYDRRLALLGGVGYEDVDDGTLTDEPQGVTWNAGFAYTPNPRTSLRATYGRRFDARNVALDASHSLSRRTTFRAQFTEAQITVQRLVNQNLNFLTVDVNGDLIDSRTGLPFDSGNPDFGLQSDTIRRRAFNATLVGTRGRNTFDLSANWQARKTDSTGIEQIVIGTNGRFQRRLSQRSTASISGSFRNTDFGDAAGRIDNLFTIGGDLRYRVFRSANAVLAFIRTQRRSNGESNGLTENSVSLSLRQEF